MFTKARATGDTLLRLLWNQGSPVYHNGIVATVNTGLQGYYRGQATVGYMKGSPAEMTFSVTTPAAPTSAPISVPVTTSNIIGTNAAGSNACFAGTFSFCRRPACHAPSHTHSSPSPTSSLTPYHPIHSL